MFGVGSLELLVVVLAAFIFIGPQKLPGVLRQFKDFSTKIRSLTSGARQAVDDVVKMAQLDDIKKEKRQIDALLTSEEHDTNQIG